MQNRLTTLAAIALVTLPVASAHAFDVEHALRVLHPQVEEGSLPELRTAQNSGMSLAEAIESVRRKTNGRIIDAKTRVSGNREVHHIKVLTKDGKVQTHRVQGRKRGNG